MARRATQTYRCDGDRIRLERDRRCWAQGDLARESGLGRRTICRMEAGESVSQKAVHDVAVALELNFDSLVMPERCRHNLPHPVRYHVARSALLDDVARALEGGGAVCLSGAGGVGKTELATAAARRLMEGYHQVVWVAGPVPDLDVALSQLAPVVGAEERGDPVQQVQAVREALASQRSLLVLDDVVDPHAWRAWQLDAPHGLLMTSRLRLKGAKTVAVAGLSDEESVTLLKGDRSENPGDLLSLAAQMGNLTIALATARDLLDDGLGLAELMQQVEAGSAWSDVDPDEVSFSRSPSLGALFASSVERLEAASTGVLAKRVLEICGQFATGSVEQSLVERACTLSLEASVADVQRALALLVRTSLLNRREGAVWLHPLLHGWLRDQNPGTDAADAAIIAAGKAVHAGGGHLSSRALVPHIPHSLAMCQRLHAGSPVEHFYAAMCLGSALHTLGRHRDVVRHLEPLAPLCPDPYIRAALTLATAHMRAMDSEIEAALEDLATAAGLIEGLPERNEHATYHYVSGKVHFERAERGEVGMEVARDHDREALRITERLCGEHAARTRAARASLAQDEVALGNYAEAMDLYAAVMTSLMTVTPEDRVSPLVVEVLLREVQALHAGLGTPDADQRLLQMSHAIGLFENAVGDHPQVAAMRARYERHSVR